MVVLSENDDYAVVIIRFDVDPQKHHALINAAIDNTEKVMKKKPGFISASFHKSLDGTSVLNYAQWKSREIYDNSMNNMSSYEAKILQRNRSIIDNITTNIDFNIYELEFTHGKHNITIAKDNTVATFVNFFSVQSKKQQELIDVWKEFVKAVVEKQPGFISANLHTSMDGTRVVNYAQWKTKEDQERMIESPEAKAWRNDFIRLADVTPNFYDIVYTSE